MNTSFFWRLIASISLIILTSFGNVSYADNPIAQTIFTADPAPMVYDGTLYLYTGHDEDTAPSSRFIMHDYQCFSTTDMVNWTHHGAVLDICKVFAWSGGDANAGQGIETEKNETVGMYVTDIDNMSQKYFVEVMCADGKPRRIVAGDPVEAGQWYDIRANAVYDIQSKKTKLQLEVKPSKDENFGKPVSGTFDGPALRRDAGMWVIGCGYPGGFPNALQVLDGAIDEVRIRI